MGLGSTDVVETGQFLSVPPLYSYVKFFCGAIEDCCICVIRMCARTAIAVNVSYGRELRIPHVHTEYALCVEVVLKPVNVERVEDLVKARGSESVYTCE